MKGAYAIIRFTTNKIKPQKGAHTPLLYVNDIMINNNCQWEILDPEFNNGFKKIDSELEKFWNRLKQSNMYLSEVYQKVDKRKAYRLNECANYLEFAVGKDKSKLMNMSSCRVRLCPLCQWRRSLRTYYAVRKIVQRAQNDCEFLALTLTCKNVDGENLSSTIDNLMKAWQKLSQLKAFKNAVVGWVRSFEITHDTQEFITEDMWHGNKFKHIYPRKDYYIKNGLAIGDKNPNYDMYHPHFHVVCAVRKDYFKSAQYISHDDFISMWQKSMRVNYAPSVRIQHIFGELSDAVGEITKYSAKPSDYAIVDDFQLSVDTVSVLDPAIDRRQFVAFGGLLAKIKKELNLEADDQGSLINVNPDADPETTDTLVARYVYRSGYYQRLD